MAVQHPQLPRLARDLIHNPVACGVSLHLAPSAATRILEAQVPAYVSDWPLTWLLCDADACEREARDLAAAYLPYDIPDLRDATVAEISEISGLSVLGSIAGAA